MQSNLTSGRLRYVCGEDRISNLPDGLIQHIFSFLDIKKVLQICMLSRRMRYLWVSLPTLRISDLSTSMDKDDFVTLNRFINFVNRLLLLRDSSDIQTLQFEWKSVDSSIDRLKLKYDVSSPIATWIMAAVKHNLQDLKFYISTNQKIKFPDCFFTCQSLTKLKFSGSGRDMTHFVLPKMTMYNLPQLRYLALTGVSVVGDGNSTSKLFSSCPVLESLLLTNCSITFEISSLSLKHFELDNHGSSDDCANTIKLSAPNLTSLICKDYMSQDYSLENLSSLVTADIGMRLRDTYEDGSTETPKTYSELDADVKELYRARMIKFVRAVHKVTDLRLSSSPGILEVVSGSLDFLGDDVYFRFCNLRVLKVVTWVTRNCFNAIAYFVKISPNIESISLTIEQTVLNANINTGGDWIVGSSSFPCLHYLKSVEIRGLQGCLNELKFLQVLLKKAVSLEKVTIFCFRNDSPYRAAQLMEFQEMLLAYPSASSSVSISILS